MATSPLTSPGTRREVGRVKRDLVLELLALLEEARITPSQLISYARTKGLSEAKIGEHTPFDSVIMLESATELTGDPYLGLRLGQRLGIESYGTLGFALMSCANLRESTMLMLRYGKVFFEPLWEYETQDSGLLIWPSLLIRPPELRRLITELCFSQLSAIGRSLHRGKLDGAQIYFDFPAPRSTGIYETIFGVEPTFDADRSQIFIPQDVLDTPVRTASLSEHLVFHRQCEEMLRSLDSAEQTTADVRCLLMQSAGQFHDITQVAERLNMSERTLRRRLAAESTSFRDILDEIRNLLAKEYLAKTELVIAEIAYLLDYEETGNFRRAFVRWNGITPSEYRLVHSQRLAA